MLWKNVDKNMTNADTLLGNMGMKKMRRMGMNGEKCNAMPEMHAER